MHCPGLSQVRTSCGCRNDHASTDRISLASVHVIGPCPRTFLKSGAFLPECEVVASTSLAEPAPAVHRSPFTVHRSPFTAHRSRWHASLAPAWCLQAASWLDGKSPSCDDAGVAGGLRWNPRPVACVRLVDRCSGRPPRMRAFRDPAGRLVVGCMRWRDGRHEAKLSPTLCSRWTF